MGFWNKFKKKEESVEKGSVVKQIVDNQGDKQEKQLKKSVKKVDKQDKKSPDKIATSASKRSTATILEPIVTEKTAKLSDQGVIVLKVAKNANRIMVRQAVRELYKVNPIKINIINVRGKRVNFGRQRGKRVDYKKALVILPKGTRVDIFEGV
ncbi:MAG: 50S ribosomal protein L23 [Patescibacteria group bacterium]